MPWPLHSFPTPPGHWLLQVGPKRPRTHSLQKGLANPVLHEQDPLGEQIP